MLKLYFCDDNRRQLETFSDFGKKAILLKTEWDVGFAASCSSPTELLAVLPSPSDTGLYFLDIDFKDDIDGFELAKRIREVDPRAFLVFITSHADLAPLTFRYRLEAMDFIYKDQPSTIRTRIVECICDAYTRYEAFCGNSEEFLTLKRAGGTENIRISEILSIRTSDIPHQVEICLPGEITGYYATLDSLEKELGEDFARCHRSCLVNKKQVVSVDKKKRELQMTDGSVLQCSYRNLKFFT
ncbi:MAG: LytTR family DNA-binding domain-containing protein [Candidatus Limivivens sp.]|nr:LytTR family DNA-binding domain-containing protein [Candidatus Limivivens sp.]